MKRHRVLPVLMALALASTACSDAGDDAAAAEDAAAGAAAEGAMTGLFAVTEGTCTDGAITAGSYFRMVQPNGTVADGPFVENGDSPCGDKTWTPLLPGTDGGLIAGSHQPPPEPVFDDSGNALADAIVQPTTFFAVAFGVATSEVDPQTSASVGVPTISHDGNGALSGDLAAWGVAYNGAHFNQGAPKPDGSMPGNTTDVSGTYDPASGAYTLEWSSQIVGGPFNNFTGIWHLEGTFEG